MQFNSLDPDTATKAEPSKKRGAPKHIDFQEKIVTLITLILMPSKFLLTKLLYKQMNKVIRRDIIDFLKEVAMQGKQPPVVLTDRGRNLHNPAVQKVTSRLKTVLIYVTYNM